MPPRPRTRSTMYLPSAKAVVTGRPRRRRRRRPAGLGRASCPCRASSFPSRAALEPVAVAPRAGSRRAAPPFRAARRAARTGCRRRRWQHRCSPRVSGTPRRAAAGSPASSAAATAAASSASAVPTCAGILGASACAGGSFPQPESARATALQAVSETIGQRVGQAELSNLRLSSRNVVRNTSDTCPSFVGVKHEKRRLGIAVARLADRAGVEEPGVGGREIDVRAVRERGRPRFRPR